MPNLEKDFYMGFDEDYSTEGEFSSEESDLEFPEELLGHCRRKMKKKGNVLARLKYKRLARRASAVKRAKKRAKRSRRIRLF